VKRFVAVLVVVIAFAGCGFLSSSVAPGSVIDGWRIGQPVDCGPDPKESECDEFIPAAVTGFDRRDPGRLPVTSVVLYGQGDPLAARC
jgi:hypothetical protein